MESDTEIREVADRIKAHGERDPLYRNSGLFKQDLDFKVLYNHLAKERFDFSRGNLGEAIKKSGGLRK